MIRLLLGALAVALCVPGTPAEANAARPVPGALAEANAAGSRALPMQFEWWQEGPADICGMECRTWVSAIGSITADTPHQFTEFAREHDLRGAMLVLDSGGGSVLGAMALGRQVRKLGMTTSVGKTIDLPSASKSAKPRAKLSPKADCESMCVFVLLAGVERTVPRGARLLVHQIWLGDRRDDAAAATYSAEDLVLVQRDIGRLAQYTIEMGASIDFLELSLRVPPWEPMRALARDEIRRMRVDTTPDVTAQPAEPATAATSVALTSGARRSVDAAARGWVVVERSGQPILLRTHPLTVEGEEIGSFDLMINCGSVPESLDIGYSERRMAAVGVAAPLKTLTLSLGALSEALQVVSSEPKPPSLQWSTQARGNVPLSFIRSFSNLDRALVISTVSANETRTAIRVGNSGMQAGFARLQESCRGRGPLHATNARTGQTAAQ